MTSRVGGFPLVAQGPGRVLIAGSFLTASSDSPTGVRGNGFSVARTEAGRYTVTLNDAVQDFTAILTDIALETKGSSLYTQLDQDVTDTNSFEIQIRDADTLVDDAGSRVSFIAVARTSNLGDNAQAS